MNIRYPIYEGVYRILTALFIVVNKSAHLGEQTCSPKWAVHESLY